MMHYCLLVLLFVPGSLPSATEAPALSRTGRADQARARLQDAQSHYINGDLTAMMRSLIQALTAEGRDPVIVSHAIQFAKKYYAQKNPVSLAELPKDLVRPWTLLMEPHKSRQLQIQKFSVNFKIADPKRVHRIYVLAPDGRTIDLYGPDYKEGHSQMRSEKMPGMFTFLSTSREYGDLPSGLYLVHYEIDGHDPVRYPLILETRMDAGKLPEAKYDHQKGRVEWKLPFSASYEDGIERVLLLKIQKRDVDRPVWMEEKTIAKDQTTGAVSNVRLESGNYILKPAVYEKVRLTGLDFYYHHSGYDTELEF